MSRKFSFVVAAAIISVAAISSSHASVANDRFEITSTLNASAADVAPFAGHFAIGGSATQDFVAGNPETNSHIAQTGIWSGIKSAAKAVGGKVKSAAKKVVSAGKTVVNAGKTIKNGVQGLGNKVMNAGTTLGSKMTGAIKKGVSAAGKVIGNAPGIKQAKKLAQKIGTKIGKAIANRL